MMLVNCLVVVNAVRIYQKLCLMRLSTVVGVFVVGNGRLNFSYHRISLYCSLLHIIQWYRTNASFNYISYIYMDMNMMACMVAVVDVKSSAMITNDVSDEAIVSTQIVPLTLFVDIFLVIYCCCTNLVDVVNMYIYLYGENKSSHTRFPYSINRLYANTHL